MRRALFPVGAALGGFAYAGFALAYLHSTEKLSRNAVGAPLAVMVRWKFSWTRKSLPVDWPITRKLFTNVVVNGNPTDVGAEAGSRHAGTVIFVAGCRSVPVIPCG